jgi:hypothetical protein
VPVLRNWYPIYLNLLQSFYNEYLDTEAFRNIINISPTGFYQPAVDQVRVIVSASSDLLYANGQTGKEPKKDFKSKGPYQLPLKPANFKFFFIYLASDKQTAVKHLYKWLNSGFTHPQFPFPKCRTSSGSLLS